MLTIVVGVCFLSYFNLSNKMPEHSETENEVSSSTDLFLRSNAIRSGKKQTGNNFYENDDTFETEFTRHVSVVQRPSSVESSYIWIYNTGV